MLRVVADDDARAELIARAWTRSAGREPARMLAAALGGRGRGLRRRARRRARRGRPPAGGPQRPRPGRGRSRRRPAGSRSRRRGWTTAGSTRPPASGDAVPSSIIPPWCRKSPKVAEVLPLMYLHGMSSGDFAPALAEFFGLRRRVVAVGDHPADQLLAGRARAVLQALSGRRRLRVRVGRRRALQRPPRGGTAVLSRDRRSPRRWPQGARRDRRRLPGVDRELGGHAA